MAEAASKMRVMDEVKWEKREESWEVCKSGDSDKERFRYSERQLQLARATFYVLAVASIRL